MTCTNKKYIFLLTTTLTISATQTSLLTLISKVVLISLEVKKPRKYEYKEDDLHKIEGGSKYAYSCNGERKHENEQKSS